MQDATEPQRCTKCHRVLRRPSPDGYGPKCRAKVRKAPVDLADYQAHQVASARELIEDGGIVPLRSVVFLVVSTDGTEIHRTAPTGCNCKVGLKGTRCYHQLAARMLLAA
ncbi:hypothetical protein [Streptomyces mirabilis]|uniref:hypothetical protein n=1 Tax=Streptomyces mirabilis TaxID=68239 RepID=UPI00367AC153